MLMTVDFVRRFINTEEEDQALEARLQALELVIKKYTHNDFRRHLTEEGEYPMDVKMGVIELLEWKLNYGGKVGIASESLSRHSVTYVNMTGNDFVMGYPKAKMGFLKPYMRASFGQGLGL